MKLYELLDRFSDTTIVVRLSHLYPDDHNKDGYYQVIKTLRGTQPVESRFVIKFDDIEPLFDGEEGHIDVYGYDADTPEEEAWSLSLTSWAEWLDMEVELNGMHPLDAVCHCLWEMTFYGFHEECHKEVLEELNRRLKDVDEAERTGDYSAFKQVVIDDEGNWSFAPVKELDNA